MHCYSTFFFGMLMGPDNERPHYDLPRAMTMSGNIDGVNSVLDLCKLYIPINKNHDNWLLLRVRPEDKTIELWDSFGYSETNKVYMQLQPQDQTTLDNWRLE